MSSLFRIKTPNKLQRSASPIRSPQKEEVEDDDEYFFVNPGNEEGSSGTPASQGSDLYYTPSISPASAYAGDDRSPVYTQTPVKHDRSTSLGRTPITDSRTPHMKQRTPTTASRTPHTKHTQSKAMRTPGKDVVSAQKEKSAVDKDIEDFKTTTKWITMLNNWGFTVMFRSGTLRRRLRRGIPASLRPMAWARLCDIRAMKYRIPDPHQLDLSKVPKGVKEDIEKDLDRTFPEHEWFRGDGDGQVQLRRLLSWYAATDPQTQYCQGMSFVAGLLLTYLTTEEAFYAFKHCLGTMGLRYMYLPGLEDLQRRQYVFTQLGYAHMNELWSHLMDNGVQPMMYATEWFMTLFCRGFDFQLSTRVVEIFMFEGFKILYRVALTIINSMKEELMSGGFEEMLRIIRERSKEIDPRAIMIDAFSWEITSLEIQKFEKYYDQIAKEQNR